MGLAQDMVGNFRLEMLNGLVADDSGGTFEVSRKRSLQ
jgi:hypothetical protein